jgi:hypothetical protein
LLTVAQAAELGITPDAIRGAIMRRVVTPVVVCPPNEQVTVAVAHM